ncbi:long-chain-fatty-acid-CoA ligase [Vibrio astriarenae]|nr:long-chain-fatty-acid-CoA ligase [Vibrio sp. C7]
MGRRKPNEVYLKQIINRQFVEFTFAEVADKALRLASALQNLGAKPGDRIALISKNCAEWFICDLAMSLGDFVSVPIFPTAAADTIEYCITHSGSKILLAGKLDDPAATQEVIDANPDVISIALPYDTAPKCQHLFSTLIEQNEPTASRPEHYDDKVMSLVYTSGTSGLPKGAMLTYGAFSWSVEQLKSLIGIQDGDRLFSYLPLAHITERVYIFGSSIAGGVCTASQNHSIPLSKM